MNECVFCNIVARNSPGTFIYEDDTVAVIETIHPISKGHVLVIPKQHYENILDVDVETLKQLAVATQNIAKTQVVSHHADGVNVLHAAGEAAQQSVFHFHFHIVPRYHNDGLDLWFKNKL